MIGQTLAHYRVTEKLGEGGMGEVYRARDGKLGRDVAIKVLPAAFAHDPERLGRFQREAQLLASLNHPNIGAIHGLEEADGIRFLVLELVPGQTLAERLASGPLPREEAVQVCRQIAEALEAAHEKGIIHRDLKPGNVKVTPEGKVKVLDFGLAKAFEGEAAAAADLSKSPTLSSPATQRGVLLGTAAYMSPEQARGKPLDKRTDIWSFGCVLYEALTARQVFKGETVTDTIAAIVKEEPDWRALPADTPAHLRVLLRRCLQKDPARRLHDIADARLELEEAASAEAALAATLPAAGAAPRPAWRQVIPWGLAALMAVLTAVALWEPWESPPAARVARFAITLPGNLRLRAGAGSTLALSPDGSLLVFAGRPAGGPQLYLRRLDQIEATPIPGTEGASSPFFSPDGQWVGFFAAGKLRKVSVTGGAVVNLCDAPAPFGFGATWGPDDTIIFTPSINAGLFRVSAAGGKPEPVTTLDPKNNEVGHRWPAFLPGGKAVLFTIAIGRTYDEARIAVVSLETRKRWTVFEGGTYPRYAPTGHLLYARSGGLLAVPFDLDAFQVTGTPVSILDNVPADPLAGAADIALSEDGTLAYAPGGTAQMTREFLWVDRRGATLRLLGESRRSYAQLRLSPEGRRIAATLREANSDIWVYEIPRGTLTRLTFDPDEDEAPVWTPDGKRVVYGSQRGAERKILWKAADGSGEEEVLLTGQNHSHPVSWSPDGRVLAFEELDPITGWDLWVLEVAPKGSSPPAGQSGGTPAGTAVPRAGTPRPFLRTPFMERQPEFSPDGRWIAYSSNESGREEVYVQPFPGPGGKWQISVEGGGWPLWARNGRELFYRSGDNIMGVAIETQPSFRAGIPRVVFSGGTEYGAGLGANYDIAPDGRRFVIVRGGEVSAPTHVYVVLNWLEELKRRASPAKK